MEEKHISQIKNTVLLKKKDIQIRQMLIPVGERVPKHYHNYCTDIIIPLSGKTKLITKNGETPLISSKYYILKPKEEHTLINNGNVDFIYLLMQDGKYDFILV